MGVGNSERPSGASGWPSQITLFGETPRYIPVIDVIAIAAVPAVLLGMAALPPSVERSLMFNFQNPELQTAFASHFVHFTSTHLASNVLGYLAVAPLAYLLAVESGRRRGFRVAYVTFVAAFPLALSALNLVVTRPGVTGGFSGIVMAFLGFVAFVLPEAVSRTVRTDVGAGLRSPWLFFLGLGLVAHLAGPGWLTGVAAAAVLAGLLFFLPVATAVGRPAPSTVRRAATETGRLWLGLAGAVVLVGYLVAAFPADPSVDAGVVNVYVHLVGFALGYLATYVAVGLAGA